jgi:hypothetical protein
MFSRLLRTPALPSTLARSNSLSTPPFLPRVIDHPDSSSLRLRRLKSTRHLGSRVGIKRVDAGLSGRHPTRSCRSCLRRLVCLEARTRSTPFIHVDHDVSLPAIPSTPRTGRCGDHLIVGFATSLVACQHIDSFPPPQVTCTPVALQTDYVPLRHMLPELERLINAFYSSLLSPLHAPASYCIWLKQCPRHKRPGFRLRYRRAPQVSNLPTSHTH